MFSEYSTNFRIGFPLPFSASADSVSNIFA
jgi:hypothetical protein